MPKKTYSIWGPDAINIGLQLEKLLGVEFDAGSFTTNLFLSVPEDKDAKEIAESLMAEAGLTFTEIMR